MVCGLWALWAAIRFVRAPRSETVGVLRALSAATTFAALAGSASNVAAVCLTVPEHPQWSVDPKVWLIVLTGVGESLAPIVLGGALLSVAWLVAAVAGRRAETLADASARA